MFHADWRMDRQTDRQTDMTKLIAFSSFANAPQNLATKTLELATF